MLIVGPSGAGKSSLALQLMAYGARLVADDKTELRLKDTSVIAACPHTISGLIEARGVGLLNADVVPETPVRVIIDLTEQEKDRLPHSHSAEIHGVTLPVLLNVVGPHFPAAILQFLKAGRKDTP